MSRYIAKAVHFDGNTYLSNAALASVDNGKISYSFWFRDVVGPDLRVGGDGKAVFWTDPTTSNATRSNFNPPAANNSALNFGLKRTGDAGAVAAGSVPMVTDTRWHHAIYSYDASLPVHPAQLYVDRNLVTGTLDNITTPAFVTNGKPAFFGWDNVLANDKMIGDIADFWCAPGVSLIDPASLTILPSTLDKFINEAGYPQNPSGFPAGAVVLFSGDAVSFSNNQGTGGAFAVTGALTNASSSPSDGPVGFVFPIRTTVQPGATVEAGWSDPQSAFAYLLCLDNLSANFLSEKINRIDNVIEQQVTIAAGAPPALSGMTSNAGMVGPWSDLSRMWIVSYFDHGGPGPFDWYVTSLNRTTLLPTTLQVAAANANPATGSVTGLVNDANQLAATQDGRFIAFCRSSDVTPTANESHIGIFDSQSNNFAFTTATSLGIVNDSFQIIIFDKDGFLYAAGQDRNVYKLALNPVSLALTLVTTIDLRPFLPPPSGRWQPWSMNYHQPTDDILVWLSDSAIVFPASSTRMVEITRAGGLVRSMNFPAGMFYPCFGSSDILAASPMSGWTTRTQFVGATFVGAHTNFEIIDTLANTVSRYPDTLWTVDGIQSQGGLPDFDGGSIWLQTDDILTELGLNPLAQLFFPPSVFPGEAKLPITPPQPYRPLHPA